MRNRPMWISFALCVALALLPGLPCVGVAAVTGGETAPASPVREQGLHAAMLTELNARTSDDLIRAQPESRANVASASDPLTPDWFYAGTQSGAQVGFVVHSAGDVNGDGYADVIVGSRYYSAPGYTQTGRAYFFLGSASGLPSAPSQTIEPPVLNSYGFFGNSVGTAGDVNGDGYNDVIIGMPNYEGGSIAPQDEGSVFVWYGSETGLGPTHDWMSESNTQWAHLGVSSGTAGDVNGDGYDDIIVGASLTVQLNTVAHAYVWYGSSDGLGDAGTPGNADWTAQATTTQAYTGFGWSVGTAGDVNGDGYADVVVAAPLFDNLHANEGAVFVWHGSGSGLGDSGTPANADWKVYGGQADARLGGHDPNGANTAGDVNGDGYDDLIAGVYGYDNPEASEGRAYVWHGSPSGLSATADWTAEGHQAGASLGFMVGSAGDVNDDGYDDILVSAHGYDTAITNAGAAFIWHGSAGGLGDDGTPTNADRTAAGDQVDGCHGQAVGATGDVDADGLDDIIVGAPMYDNPGAADGGRAYVYHGSSSCWARLNNASTDYHTVQAAVDASTSPDDVVKVAGTCSGVWARDRVTQTVYLSKTLTIQGGYTTTNWTTPDPVANPTTLDAQGLGRVLYITGDIAPTIEGLRITGGDAAGLGGIGESGERDGGGGIYVTTATATISNCAIYTNTAEGGAAIALANSGATLEGNDIHHNLATNQGGGGLLIGGPGTATISGNAIHDNDSLGGGGGAVACFYSSPTLSGNEMVGNASDESGGAVYLEGCDGATLTNNEVLTNTAGWSGGGLYLEDSPATVRDNTIQGNQCEWEGGGLYIYDSAVTLTGNLIRANDADNGVDAGSGGGLKIEGAASNGATLTGNEIVENTVRWVGAGVFVKDCSPTLSDNWIHHNAGNEGSGITVDAGAAVITNNTIAHNTASWRAGALALRSGTSCALMANVIRNNQAGSEGGAGRIQDGSSPLLINNALIGNELASGGGGAALHIVASSPRLVHTTMANNSGGSGAAIQVLGEESEVSTVVMTNTIIADHAVGVNVAAGSTAALDGVLWFGTPTKTAGDGITTVEHAVDGNPAFDTDGYHLTYTSAAIDAGVDAGVTTDIDGGARPIGRPDLGADEQGTRVFLPLTLRNY